MEVLGKGSLSEGKRLPSPSLPTRIPSLAFQRHLCLSACPQRPHQSADCLRGVQGPCSKAAKIGISSPQLQGGILFWGRPPSFSSFLPGSFFDRSEALRRKPEQWAQQRPLRTQKAGSRRETVFFPKRFQRTAYGFSTKIIASGAGAASAYARSASSDATPTGLWMSCTGLWPAASGAATASPSVPRRP
jgi:hypothetical protein